ncbi:ATP-binding cassette subfamily B protein [Streptacidiphilus sp. MAP12-20]|uniref:ABC transporter ATP-binding protein n=1 Tax=Streptacidiphilus sp. MAP12-20 TaxID=3156299 RepID=UPI003512100C
MSTAETSTVGVIDEAQGGAVEILRRGLRSSADFLVGMRLTVLLGLVAVAGRVVLPITVQRALDGGVRHGGGTAAVVWPVAGAMVAVLLTAACSYAVSIRLYRVSETGLAASRVSAFRHLHALPLVRQESQPRGALVARVTSDIDTVSSFLQYKGLMLALSTLQMVATTVVMACYSVWLTLLVWALQLPLLVFLNRSQSFLAPRFGRLQERVGEVLAVASEALAGAETVRGYDASGYVVARADRAVTELATEQMRAQRAITAVQSLAELVPSLITVALAAAGVELVAHGWMSLGDLAAVLFLAVLFVSPTRQGVVAFTEAQRALAGWRRLLGVLDAPGAAAPAAGKRTLPDGPLGIGFEQVGFSYPTGRPVLEDFSLELVPGRRVAVVGETGAGKTTFAKLACGLVEPGRGRVLVGGVPLDEVDRASLRRRMVIVPQEGFLFDTTIAANVRFTLPDASPADIRRAFVELGLGDWLDGLPLGLDTPVGPGGALLSAGERQMVALARAHAADPAVLILDEATSAVDPDTEVRIQAALDRLTSGRTSITVAHRLISARSADLILVFDAGRIVESGPHHELLACGGPYAALHDAWIARPAQG